MSGTVIDSAPALPLDVLETELNGIEAQLQEFAAMEPRLQQQLGQCQMKLVELGGQRTLVRRLIELAKRTNGANATPNESEPAR